MTKAEQAHVYMLMSEEYHGKVDYYKEGIVRILDNIVRDTQRLIDDIENERNIYNIATYCGNTNGNLHDIMGILAALREANVTANSYHKIAEIMTMEKGD